ncbi:carboxypeptidase-like regulatory domain-containing protein [Parabacteroides faecis]|nr:carboxypeptidase-like regulatory domain-containing protein [Parabacteroides faecis]UVQ46757.1 carboxypeptidase-like regulatory domain-containing protein [Parabacteroides faecis]
MMKKKVSFLLAGMLMCMTPAMNGATIDGGIKGTVMDGELGGPLEFVTVQVKAKGSDKILQGSVTGSDGNYSIGGLKKGEYVVTFSYIGYGEVSKTISIGTNSQVLNLGELTLEEDANQLNEVEIVAKRPQMRF